jgi:hypothetical protein
MIPPCNLAITTWKEFTGFSFLNMTFRTSALCLPIGCHEHDERLAGSLAPGFSSRHSVLGGQAHLEKGALTTTPPSSDNVCQCQLQHGQGHFVSPETKHFHRAGNGVLVCSDSVFRDSLVHKTRYANAHAPPYVHARSHGFVRIFRARQGPHVGNKACGHERGNGGEDSCTIKGSEKHSKYQGIIITSFVHS